MNIWELSASDLSSKVREGSLRPLEVVNDYFDRIEEVDPGIKSYLSLMKEPAQAQAKALEAKRSQGRSLGRLAGVPVAVKDNILIQDFPTTCASKILENYRGSYTATAAERLIQEDAIILGKTNMDEFAMGSSTENSAFGVTRNPWDRERVPGGSSGGSAAAVAAGLAAAALGSDTGGSIRQPASFCGLVGLKPTYGWVSRFGLVAFASSLDQIGPLTRTAGDAALIFQTIAGPDPKDSTSSPASSVAQEPRTAKGSLKGVTFGVPKEFTEAGGVDPEVAAGVEKAVKVIEAQGATIRPVSLPHSQYSLAAYYILAPSEASANLARFDGMRYGRRSEGAGDDLTALYKKSRSLGFGREVQRRILIGTFALSHGYYEAYYGKAQEVRRRVAADFEEAFRQVQFLLSPTAPTPAFRIGEKSDDPVAMYLSDIFTIPVNLAGIPAASFPCGFTQGGLPVGCQMIGPSGSDLTILDLVGCFEDATDRCFIRPALAGVRS